MNRRGFLGGMLVALAAPAIVRSGLLMPVKPVVLMPEPLPIFMGKGFPTMEAPSGALYEQQGSLVRATWIMGGDGKWGLLDGHRYERPIAETAFKEWPDLDNAQWETEEEKRRLERQDAELAWIKQFVEPPQQRMAPFTGGYAGKLRFRQV